jgi:hypothetical protein
MRVKLASGTVYGNYVEATIIRSGFRTGVIQLA